MQTLLYVLGNIFLACVNGLLFIRVVQRYNIPPICKFLVGCSLTPYVLGIYMLLVTIIPCRLNNYVYLGILYLIAIAGYKCFTSKERNYELFQEIRNCFTGYWEIITLGLVETIFSGFVNIATINVITFVIGIVIAQSILFAAVYYYKRNFKTKKVLYGFNALYLFLLLFQEKFFFLGPNKIYGFIITILLFGISIIVGISYVLFSPKEDIKSTKMVALYGLLWCGTTIYHYRNYIPNYWNILLLVTLLAVSIFITLLRYNNDKQFKYRISLFVRDLIYFFSICFVFSIIRYLMINGINAIVGSDAIQYMSEAYDYAVSMKFGAMNDFHGDLAGSLLSNIHSPIWPAYLSNGLIYSNNLGYPFDYGSRAAFMLSFLYILCAIFAYGYYIKDKLLGLLTCALFFCNEKSIALINNSSRDGFRIIPIVAFCILLTALPEKKNAKVLVPLSLICMFIMIGHPINAITAIGIFAAYTVYYLLFHKGNILEYIKIVAACVGGALAGSYQIIWAFIETGSMTGGLIDFEDVLYGTSYYNTYTINFTQSLGSEVTYLQKMIDIISKDNGLLSIAAVVATVIILLLWLLKKKEIDEKMLFVVFVVLIQFLLFTDIFAWSGRSYVDWCYRNYRYTIQMYVFYALVISLVIEHMVTVDKRFFGGTLGLLLCGVYLFIAFRSGNENLKNIRPREKRKSNYDLVWDIMQEHKPGKMLLDNYNTNYYFFNEGLCFWTKPLDVLRRKDSDEAFYQTAKELKISSILITNSYRELYWKDTELERFTMSDYIVESINIPDDEKPVYSIYVLREESDNVK